MFPPSCLNCITSFPRRCMQNETHPGAPCPTMSRHSRSCSETQLRSEYRPGPDGSDPCVHLCIFLSIDASYTLSKWPHFGPSHNPRGERDTKQKNKQRKGMNLTFYVRKCEFQPDQVLPSWKWCHPMPCAAMGSTPWMPEWTRARPSVGFSPHHA